MKNQSKRATVYFDSQLHRVLRLKAAETHRSVSAIINDAVNQGLAEDAEDMTAFELRASEPNLVFEKVLQDMKKRGQI